MRAPIAAILTGIIFLNLFGFYLIFMVRQGEAKTEMAVKMMNTPSSQLQVLSFDKGEFSSLQFSDDGKELTVDGKLYDVVNMQHKGNRVYVTIEFDSKETELVQDFVALFNGKTTGEKEVPLKDLLQLLQKEFIAQDTANTFTTSNGSISYLPQLFYGCAGASAGILVPPPCSAV